MNKLFDLRFVIGLFFLVIGVLLLTYAWLISHEAVNYVCGLLFAGFGGVMIYFSSGQAREEEEQ